MKINFFIAPILQIIFCRDNLDCPKNHVCIHGFFFNFCRPAEPKYRPVYVYS